MRKNKILIGESPENITEFYIVVFIFFDKKVREKDGWIGEGRPALL